MLESENAMDKASELAAAWLRREGLLADGLAPEAKARKVVFGGAPRDRRTRDYVNGVFG